MLSDLIVSATRVKILELLFGSPERIFHTREIARLIKKEINSVRRESLFLVKRGILAKEPRANRICYSLRKDYPYYFDLLNFVAKSTGLGGEILKNRVKLGKIKFAALTLRFARHLPRVESSEVDVLIVGSIVLPELAQLIRGEETVRGHEINYSPFTEEEFKFRKNRKDPFLAGILQTPKVIIIGDEEDLMKNENTEINH